jgi:hypothetical protein
VGGVLGSSFMGSHRCISAGRVFKGQAQKGFGIQAWNWEMAHGWTVGDPSDQLLTGHERL